MDDWLNKIAIAKIPNVGPITARNLISYCGGVEEVFKAKQRTLEKVPGIGIKTAKEILQKAYFKIAEEELAFIEKNNIQPLFFLDDAYPTRLKPLEDSPIILYYKGNADLNHPRIVAIVGTRKPTKFGSVLCEELVADLKAYDVLIVSGLAYGIDVTAHRRCLELGIETVGVLGHGLQQVYPAQHRKYAQEMVENGGLLTQFTSKVSPEAGHFPMRNKVVAGICDALVVVETGRKGGSMISAKFANEYSKDVFAMPGRIKDELSEGCNHLIKTHQAALIESAKDIGYIMRWDEIDSNGHKREIPMLTQEEQHIAELMQQSEDIGIDELTIQSKLPPDALATFLLTMEFKGVIKPLPGKRYMLLK